MDGFRFASDCSMLAFRVTIGNCWITLTVPVGPAAAAGLATGAAWVGATVAAAWGTTGAAMVGAAVGAAAAGLAASAGLLSAGLAGAGACWPQATLSASPVVLTAHSRRNRRRVSGPGRRPRSREVIELASYPDLNGPH